MTTHAILAATSRTSLFVCRHILGLSRHGSGPQCSLLLESVLEQSRAFYAQEAAAPSAPDGGGSMLAR